MAPILHRARVTTEIFPRRPIPALGAAKECGRSREGRGHGRFPASVLVSGRWVPTILGPFLRRKSVKRLWDEVVE